MSDKLKEKSQAETETKVYSVNPFYSISEYISKPFIDIKKFTEHLLDDVAEDIVTVGLTYAYFSVSVSLPAIAAFPFFYYGIKRLGDGLGESVESFIKDDEYVVDESNNVFKDILISVADDFVEDLSKGICLASKIFFNVGPVEVARRYMNQNEPDLNEQHFKYDQFFKAADFVIGSYGFASSYSSCNELANQHGHWVKEKLEQYIAGEEGSLASGVENG